MPPCVKGGMSFRVWRLGNHLATWLSKVRGYYDGFARGYAAGRRDEDQTLYDALLWISEYPNREHVYSEDDAIDLAEYARDVLARYEEYDRV